MTGELLIREMHDADKPRERGSSTLDWTTPMREAIVKSKK